MKQILQDLRSGITSLVALPGPSGASDGEVLIRTRVSLVSLGTEKMLVSFGRSSLIGKARAQPEKVAQVFAKMRSEGVIPTLEAVFRKLDEPLPLGYCNVGEVCAVGRRVVGMTVGDRVVSNGPHSEYVAVPQNLVARIPI
jgi:NADPH:quinone reductase-like Zn-dependent oxidoreductase